MTFIQRYFTALFAKVNQLDRIESDLASKASSLALTATRAELGATRRDLKALQGDVLVFQDGNNVAISLINERLSDRPTRGDLTIVASDLGARLELVENYQAALEASAEETRASIRSTISNAVANVEAAKTGEPNLRKALFDQGGIALEIRGDRTAKMVAIDPYDEAASARAEAYNLIAERQNTEAKVAKPRKPRAPKGGAK